MNMAMMVRCALTMILLMIDDDGDDGDDGQVDVYDANEHDDDGQVCPDNDLAHD